MRHRFHRFLQWLRRLRHRLDHRRAVRGRICMSKVIQVNGTTTATLELDTKEGAAATIYNTPSWSADDANSSIASMSVAADGKSAEFTGVAPGTVSVTVLANGDPTPGVDDITVTATLTVVPEEASTGKLNFS